MPIAVISDTHDRLPDRLLPLLESAEEIWHLGDACQPDLVRELARIGPPLHMVRGNNDWEGLWPETLRLERKGTVFWLVHIAPRRPPPDVHVLLHGHTHAPSDVRVGEVRYLNPGAITRPAAGCSTGFAWLTPRRGGSPAWKRVTL